MKLQLHEHISRLLFDHECVIVPGFGAFLTRYYSAEVNHATHMMRPPSKRVYFNASINENEGLLAKAISHTEGITYTQALANIKNEVANWQQILSKKKKLNLPGIGRLYIDEVSGKMQFSPSLETNFATTSYGLSIFRSPAIQREAQIRKTIHETIEKHVVTETTEGKKRKVAAWIPWAAALGPVLIAGVIGYSYLTQGPLNPAQNSAGINWLRVFNTTNIESVEAPTEEVKVTEAEVAIEEPTIATEAAETTNEVPAIAAPEIAYHIVVGSFKDQENAATYVAELQAKGYDAYIPKGDLRFFRVSVGGYATHEEANAAIAGVKMNVNPQSWVYRN